MLQERQKQILLKLETQSQPLTAQQLAQMFQISLRTIRYDIQKIKEFTTEHQIEFIRSPKVGMHIVSTRPISEYFIEVYEKKNYYYIDEKGRKLLILLYFLMKQNPVTLGELETFFSVSKNTIRTTLKTCSDELKPFNLCLLGKKNKGFYVSGSIKGYMTYFEKQINFDGSEILYNTLMNPSNQLIPKYLKLQIEKIIAFLIESLHVSVTDYQRLAFLLTIIVRQLQLHPSGIHKDNLNIDAEIYEFANYMESQCRITFDMESIEILLPILNQSTDFSERYFASFEDDYLVHSIQNIIQIICENYKYHIDDKDLLKTELFKHLKTTIENLKMGFSNENPLLAMIKETYSDEFHAVSFAVKELSFIHPQLIHENEVGFLTLYFCRSFDKAREIQKSRIMVVCNTGRSASKLLGTRLINNLPDIHIVAISSIFDIQTNKSLLDNIDFIISTLPLHNVHKPYIVVSPLLQNAEIEQIKEAIWMMSDRIVVEHTKTEKKVKNIKEIPWLGDELESLLKESDIGEFYADICMNLFTLIQRLYPKGLDKAHYNNIAGIFAHTLISVSRWKKQEYMQADDAEELFEMYPNEVSYIADFLSSISSKLHIHIPSREAVAILRYYMF